MNGTTAKDNINGVNGAHVANNEHPLPPPQDEAVAPLVESDPISPGELAVQAENEEFWEDLPEENLARPGERNPTSSLSQSSSKGSLRKRPKGKKENTAPLIDTNKIGDAFTSGAAGTARYTYDVASNAAWWFKRPFGFLLAMWALALVISSMWGRLHSAFAPLCWIPGISGLAVCRSPAPNFPQWADFPKLMEVESSTFDQLLQEVVGGSDLSLEVKMAEMAVKDLIVKVRVSDLKGKDLLAETLEEFATNANDASRSLSKWGSKVNGAVQSISAVNDHALRTIEAKLNKPVSSLSVLWPFSGTSVQQVVVQTFQEAMSILDVHLKRVLLEAQLNHGFLDQLDASLVTLHEILEREDKDVLAEKEELLAQLWTILGGNRRELKGLDGHLYLLRSLGDYRRRSLVHVTAAEHLLRSMESDMEDIRERVSKPELISDKIPLEVHIKSIQAGLDHLKSQNYLSKQRHEASVQALLGDNSA